MGIPDRLYNIAKGQLDKVSDRWNQIDARAQQELDSFLAGHGGDTSGMSAWDRATSKINAASAERELRSAGDQLDDAPAAGPSLDALEASVAAQQSSGTPGAGRTIAPQSQTLSAAYKILGVEPGSDFLTVQKAYQDLRERAAPERFPDGSNEQEAARSIQRRIESAYMMITNIIAPSTDRFDRLEI